MILDVSNYKPQDFVRIIQYNKNKIIDISQFNQPRDHKIEMIWNNLMILGNVGST